MSLQCWQLEALWQPVPLGSSSLLGLGIMTKCWQRGPVAWWSRGARLWFPRGLVGVAPWREGRRATLTCQGSFCSCPPAETKPCLAVGMVIPPSNVAAVLLLLVTPTCTQLGVNLGLALAL